MAIRPGMTNIVAYLRQYGQAATDDLFNGVTYWTDEQLQAIADQCARRGQVVLDRVNPEYTVYRLVFPMGYYMEDDITVYDSAGAEVATAATYNQDTNELTFASPVTADRYYAFGLVVSINDALAQLWQQKAEQRFDYVDFKAQNNRMDIRQEYENCLARAATYRARTVRSFDRSGRGRWNRRTL